MFFIGSWNGPIHVVREEPRKVIRTGIISSYGRYYQVLDYYIGRRVLIKLKGRTLRIECKGKRIAFYKIDERHFQDVPKPRRRDILNV